MIDEREILDRLNTAIDLEGLQGQREKMARWTAKVLAPLVRKIVIEEVRAARLREPD